MPGTGTVTATRLKLRMAAHDGALIKLLDKGTEVQVLAEEDGWLQVRVDGQEGSASADFITQDEIAKGVVRESSVSVRRAPDDGAQIIGNLSNDSEVRILAEQGDWLRIRFDDDDGYVDASEIERRPEVRQGHVTASSLNLRDAPNGARIGSLDRGTEVTILARYRQREDCR